MARKNAPSPSPTPGERANLADVARLAGVSPATASRALSGGPRVPAEELRLRVEAAAEQLRYIPHPAAQAMARGRTNVLGLIVHDIGDPYFATIASTILQAAEAEGLMTAIADTQRDPERELRYLATFRHQRARGVILAGSRSGDSRMRRALQQEIDLFREQGGRVTMVSQPEMKADTVVVRNRTGANALAHALVDHGYREFAVLAAPEPLRSSTDRLEGFREGLADRGVELDPGRVIRGEFTRDGGHDAARRLLETGPLPECVFAVNDVMAMGAMVAFRAAGLRLPEDIGVAGFDDIATARDAVPALTTVHIPLDEIGLEVVRHVLLDADSPTERTPIHCRVVLRESTPARKAPAS